MWGNDNHAVDCYNKLCILIQQISNLNNTERQSHIDDLLVIYNYYGQICCKVAGGINNDRQTPFSQQEQRLFTESLTSFKFYLDKNPFAKEIAELYKIIGVYYTLHTTDSFQSKIAILQNILVYQPLDFQVHFFLAQLFQTNNKLDESLIEYRISIDLIEQALEKDKNNTVFKNLLGQCYNSIGSIYFYAQNRDLALVYFNKGLVYCPDNPDLYNQIGVVNTELRYVDKAISAYQKAISLTEKSNVPHKKELLASIHMNMGLAKCYECEFLQGIECYNTALKYKPDLSLAFQNKLLDLNYVSHLIKDPMYIFNLHKKINNIYPTVITDYRISIPDYKIKTGNEKLKLGFVSGDFICHPVSYFLSSILENIDYDMFEIVCYTVKTQDLGDLFPNCQWFKVKHLGTNELSDLIKSHNIDILFDMSGQTGDNRLDTFAVKPAPIQISYCGYPSTSGLNSMDYHLTDSHCNSPETQKYYTEKLVFLKNCFLNYTSPLGDPKPFPKEFIQPRVKNGYITFGSFNRLNKINKSVVQVWEQILLENPTARFIIKTKEFLTESLVVKFKSWFVNKSVLDRIQILDYGDTLLDHIPDYDLMDVALDTFPYSGTTTSCEALYSGTPIITKRDNDRKYHVSNVTSSLLINSGMGEFIANDIQEYKTLAKKYANAPPELFYNFKQIYQQKFLKGHVYQKTQFINDFQDTLIDIYKNHFK